MTNGILWSSQFCIFSGITALNFQPYKNSFPRFVPLNKESLLLYNLLVGIKIKSFYGQVSLTKYYLRLPKKEYTETSSTSADEITFQ